MRLNTLPADFVVVEQLAPRLLSRGLHAVYQVRKHNATTLDVQAQIARSLHVPESDVVFAALKDKRAVAIQHASVRTDTPRPLAGDDFEAQIVGYLDRPLGPADIRANRFAIVVRDLSADEAPRLSAGLMRVERHGLPNYFDEQRFGSVVANGDHIARRILLRDAEGALRAYFAQPFAGDPQHVRAFKAVAETQWGDWQAMFEAAPRPSNYRSVLTYLRDHPPARASSPDTVFRKALNLINRRLLSLYLTAYQSLLWNRIAGSMVAEVAGPCQHSVVIAGERLPVYDTLPDVFDRGMVVPLPHHRAAYEPPEMAATAQAVVAKEGLSQSDLKPRILTKAYLPQGKRPLLLLPQDASVSEAEPDEHFAGRSKLGIRFVLPRGSYATLVIRATMATM